MDLIERNITDEPIPNLNFLRKPAIKISLENGKVTSHEIEWTSEEVVRFGKIEAIKAGFRREASLVSGPARDMMSVTTLSKAGQKDRPFGLERLAASFSRLEGYCTRYSPFANHRVFGKTYTALLEIKHLLAPFEKSS